MTASDYPPPGTTSRGRHLAVAAVAVITVMGTVGTALSPYLLVRQPLLLIALSPDVRNIVLVAAQADFLPVLAVAEPRRAMGLFAMYAMGFFYGPLAIAWFEQRSARAGRVLRWLERLFARLGAPLLVVFPAYTVGALAGVARTRLRVFVPAMLVGQVVYIGVSYFLGDAAREWTTPLVRFLGEHLVESTAVCVAAVVIHQVWSRWGRTGPKDG